MPQADLLDRVSVTTAARACAIERFTSLIRNSPARHSSCSVYLFGSSARSMLIEDADPTITLLVLGPVHERQRLAQFLRQRRGPTETLSVLESSFGVYEALNSHAFFTIDAIAYEPLSETFRMLSGARRDLERETLRTLPAFDGSCRAMAADVAMRAVRLAALCPGFSFERQTLSAVSRAQGVRASSHAVGRELLETLKAKDGASILASLQRHGLFGHVFDRWIHPVMTGDMQQLECYTRTMHERLTAADRIHVDGIAPAECAPALLLRLALLFAPPVRSVGPAPRREEMTAMGHRVYRTALGLSHNPALAFRVRIILAAYVEIAAAVARGDAIEHAAEQAIGFGPVKTTLARHAVECCCK